MPYMNYKEIVFYLKEIYVHKIKIMFVINKIILNYIKINIHLVISTDLENV